jgi:hypothetical protein
LPKPKFLLGVQWLNARSVECHHAPPTFGALSVSAEPQKCLIWRCEFGQIWRYFGFFFAIESETLKMKNCGNISQVAPVLHTNFQKRQGTVKSMILDL